MPQSSPDGKHLLFSTSDQSFRRVSLRVLNIDDRTITPFADTQSTSIREATFSPDGRWVVYSVEVDGQQTSPNAGVFVEPFPATGQRHQAPRTYRDFAPVWARDGKSIFYIPELPTIVSVPVATLPVMAFGTPVELQNAPRPGLQSNQPRGYDVLPDGRILSVSAAFDDGPSAATTGGVRVVLNWHEELKRLVPTK